MSEDKEPRDLASRITHYLASGGFFNPECMEHGKVRDLLIACRAELTKRQADDSLMQCRIEELKAENERLRNAVKQSQLAIDDWLHTFAPEHCKEEHVIETDNRIWYRGGTLAYIADVQKENRDALGKDT